MRMIFPVLHKIKSPCVYVIDKLTPMCSYTSACDRVGKKLSVSGRDYGFSCIAAASGWSVSVVREWDVTLSLRACMRLVEFVGV